MSRDAKAMFAAQRLAVLRGLLALACCCRLAQAAGADAERANLATQRAAVQSAYEAQAADCRRRFVVTACLDAVQRQRREALDALRRQQLVLDETERKQRAADRLAGIRDKQEAAAAAASAVRQKQAATKPTTTMRLRHGAPAGPERERDLPRASASNAADDVVPPAEPTTAVRGKPHDAVKAEKADARRLGREARAPAQRALAERARLDRQREQKLRLSEMVSHRQAAEQRNAERARNAKKPAAPLPVPSAASAARR